MTDERCAGDQAERDELARTVKATRKPQGSRIDKIRAVVSEHQAARVDGVFLDAVTANGLLTVYEGLNETNRAALAALPMQKMVAVMWKLVR